MRCKRMHGTLSEGNCLRYQKMDRFECRGCRQGANIIKARERRKDMEIKEERDIEELKNQARGERREGEGLAQLFAE